MSTSLFYGFQFQRPALIGELSFGRIVGVQNTNGTFTVVYETTRGPTNIGSGVAQDTSGTSLAVAILDAFGQPILVNGLANTTEQFGNQWDPSLIATADGGAALAYVSRDATGDLGVIVEKRDASGVLVFNSVRIDGVTNESSPDLSEFNNGNLLVTYKIENAFGQTELYSRFVFPNGSQSSRIIVDNHIDSASEISTDTLLNGRIAVGYVDAGGTTGRVTLINDNGFGAGSFVFANGLTPITDVSVAALSDGGYVVAWIEQHATGPQAFFGRYDAFGNVAQGRVALSSSGHLPIDVEVIGKDAGGFSVQVTELDPTDGDLSYLVTDFDAAGRFFSGMGGGILSNFPPSLLLTNDDRVISLFNRDSGSDAEFIGVVSSNREVVFGTNGSDVLFADEFGTSRPLPIFADGGNDTLYTLGVRASVFDGGTGIDTIDYSFANESVRLLSSGAIHLDNFFQTVDQLIGNGFTPTVERIVGDTVDDYGGAIRDNTVDGENSAASRFDVNLTTGDLNVTLLAAPTQPTISFEIVNFNVVLGTANDDVIRGSLGADTLSGDYGNDRLEGGSGNDLLLGGGLADTLHGNLGNDTLDGGTNFDTVLYTGVSAGVTVNLENGFAIGGAGTDVITNVEHVFGSGAADEIFGTRAHGNRLEGSLGNDSVYGLEGKDTLLGGDGNDKLYGGADGDVLIGGANNDTLDGGLGRDLLTGGAGADTFVLLEASHTGVGRFRRDEIRDFNRAEGDVIDISTVDANVYLSGNQTFSYAGTSFGGVGGQMILNDYVFSGQDVTIASFDVHGDGVADGQIYVVGGANISDFIL
ncbi:hypothetical protein JANAI62_11170 [Jannaschia pagri]|uniref:Ca2+-binding protein, RTX toxin-related n=1 Tax=Jannaschia pagri TaxID=2829797 RepID=A0ABQ4NJ81_9RHOB|nr:MULTISPECIES: calcium-binding protein [unclassified Jannaschia]GIT90662.1 hypothetical protein JANAI61_11200 [Jannaschia sp. AI_61]GIT94494.1 hypothetical protein JANAI62_11170 [Jannaschia sp. AI_62]